MKPELETEQYYDWDSSWEFLKNKYGFKNKSKVWNYICDAHEIYNGKIFTISNWELVYNNGEYERLIPTFFKDVLIAIIDEFGSVDKDCLTEGTKTCNFRASW